MNRKIAELSCVVVIALMTWVALVYSSDLVGPWYYSLGALGILAAVLLAVGTNGLTQIYWIGFSVSSVAYLGYSLQFEEDIYAPPYSGSEFTVQLLQQFRDRYRPDRPTAETDIYKKATQESGRADFDKLIQQMDAIAESAESAPTITTFKQTNTLIIGGGQRVSDAYSPGRATFFLVGHMGWALLFGWLGGYFTCYIHSRHRLSSTDARHSVVTQD